MGYSTTTPINNEISQTNSILQHTSVIAEYSDSVTDSVPCFWLREHQMMTARLIITMYIVMPFLVSSSPV